MYLDGVRTMFGVCLETECPSAYQIFRKIPKPSKNSMYSGYYKNINEAKRDLIGMYTESKLNVKSN